MTEKEFFKLIKKECKDIANTEDIQQGFPYFCLKYFFPQLSMDEIEDSIYGLRTNDESIDAFFSREDDKTMHFCQFKSVVSSGKIKPVEKRDLAFLYEVPSILQNNKYIDEHKNPKVKEIAAEYLTLKNKYSYHYHFFHLGFIKNPNLIDSYKNFNYYGLKEIEEQYLEQKSRESQTEPPEVEIFLSYNESPQVVECKIGNHRTLISIITGDEIVKLREKNKYKLFDKNLRFFMGSNKINNAIINTAHSDKANFYFYNNGITITSKRFRPKDNRKSVVVEFPQIINGAQTVDAIYFAYRVRLNKLSRELGDVTEAKEKILDEFKQIKVLFRIIQNENEMKEFERRVIEYNNTQNIIKKRDFYANSPEQVELQKMFCKYGYFYEIKRGERDYISKRENKHNILNKCLADFFHKEEKRDIETLASLWMAYIGFPSSHDVGSERIFGEEKYYEVVFPDRISEITDDYIKEMILAYNLFDLIQKETKIYTGTRSISSLLPEIETKENFELVKALVENSLIFNQIFKSKFRDLDAFKKHKEKNIEKIKYYGPLSKGKYMVLAVFKLIIDECNYLNLLINKTSWFENKEILKNNIVATWLPTILDFLLIPEYIKFSSETAQGTSAYYLRSKTFEDIKDRFSGLDNDLNKEFSEIFPIPLPKN